MHALSLAENKNHDCLTNVTDVLNNLLHEQAKGFLKRYNTVKKSGLFDFFANVLENL